VNSIPQTSLPQSTLPTTADFVIVGAGVMGASLAFHLTRSKAGRVVVLDKDYAGQGGSGRSSALVRMHYSYPPEVQLAVKSLEIFAHWREYVGTAGEFRKTGFVRIVAPNEIERLKANVAMQRALGVKAELIDAAELKKLEPDWVVDDVTLAAYEPDSGYGDGSVVANDFLEVARANGARYFPRTRVAALRVEKERVCGVVTDRGEISAGVVVGATGPWTKPLFATAGVELSIETEYHQVAILRNPPQMKRGGCACIDSGTATYFRSDGGEKTLVGDFHGRRGVDPDNFPQRPTSEEIEALVERAARRVPLLEHAEMMRGVTGIYDMTPDARPLLGETAVKGLYVMAGFSGMGFKISPAVGLVMAELLTERRTSTVDLTPFRPQRFAEGQPIRAEFEYADD
jgi:glycine/D-amino acid oxidase-like deaminating enzyme